MKKDVVLHRDTKVRKESRATFAVDPAIIATSNSILAPISVRRSSSLVGLLFICFCGSTTSIFDSHQKYQYPNDLTTYFFTNGRFFAILTMICDSGFERCFSNSRSRNGRKYDMAAAVHPPRRIMSRLSPNLLANASDSIDR